MTSKERLRAAVGHKQPDYVPASMNCVDVMWEQLIKRYNKSTKYEVMDYFNIDVRLIKPPYNGPELGERINNNGEVEKQHPYGYWTKSAWNGMEYNDIVTYHPLDYFNSAEELEQYKSWPNPDHYNYEDVKRQCERFKNKALRIGWPGPYQLITFLRSEQNFYMDMALDPEFTKKMLYGFHQFEMEHYERIFIAADGQIDVLCTSDDYGTQRGLLFSINMWREYFAENTRKLTELAHKYGAFFMQHSCGAIAPIIPDLIKCGIDMLDPVQKLPGMEPETLKDEFGDVLTFHGGIDTQSILPLGKPNEVKCETEHFIDVLNKNGGYVLAGSQDLEGDVPLENIEAMYEVRRAMM